MDIAPRGTRFDLVTPEGKIAIFSPLIGRVNVYNILSAAAACCARGCKAQAIASGVAALTHVPGRFQRVDCGQPFTVVVDYAHTDDALRNLTALAREFVTRDKGEGPSDHRLRLRRRSRSRQAAADGRGCRTRQRFRGADFAIIRAAKILAPSSTTPCVGLQKSGVKYTIEVDRRKAIALAINEARPGDIVLLAGKGHEKVQVTREGSHPFDDVEVAREILKASGFECESGSAAGRSA